jgi:hypothetical protein
MSLYPSPEHRELLLTMLRTMGVREVNVHFSGGGDSGEIDVPNTTDSNGMNIDLSSATILWPTKRDVWRNNIWCREIRESEVQALSEVLRNLTNDALEIQQIDWYNDDGGQGHLTIDFEHDPPKVELHVEINVIATDEYSFDYTEDLGEEEA